MSFTNRFLQVTLFRKNLCRRWCCDIITPLFTPSLLFRIGLLDIYFRLGVGNLMRNQYTYRYIWLKFSNFIFLTPILYFGLQSHISICIEKMYTLRLLYIGKHSLDSMSINYFHTVYYKRTTFLQKCLVFHSFYIASLMIR